MEINSPFEILSNIRQSAIELAEQGLSYRSQSAGVKNIAYVVNDVYFYCDAQDVKEVSVCQNLVPVPQTKRWMRGLINSKGVLYSVNDLSLFAGFERAIQPQKGHLLLLNDGESQSSLLVNRVIGFRYFDEADKLSGLKDKQETLDGLGGFVDAGYHIDGRDWFHLDVEKLIESEQFREIQ